MNEHLFHVDDCYFILYLLGSPWVITCRNNDVPPGPPRHNYIQSKNIQIKNNNLKTTLSIRNDQDLEEIVQQFEFCRYTKQHLNVWEKKLTNTKTKINQVKCYAVTKQYLDTYSELYLSLWKTKTNKQQNKKKQGPTLYNHLSKNIFFSLFAKLLLLSSNKMSGRGMFHSVHHCSFECICSLQR